MVKILNLFSIGSYWRIISSRVTSILHLKKCFVRTDLGVGLSIEAGETREECSFRGELLVTWTPFVEQTGGLVGWREWS